MLDIKNLAQEVREKISNTLCIQEQLGRTCSMKSIQKEQEAIIEKALKKAYETGRLKPGH